MQNKIRFIKDLLWFFVFWGLISAIFRMVFGLGATTNLSDQVPWGLWKVLNMIAGVALSTCGFTLGFLVYVLKIEKFKPLVRPAILIAFLGYGSSCLALLFDIGLPHRFWHPFIFWNEHSFLFEVFWCVILYFTVTFIELTPNILERAKAEKVVRWLHKIALGVVILGISLSSLHHSSLGSLFLTTPLRLNDLWFTTLIPWMFLSSAAGCGIMFLILAKILYSRLWDPLPVFGHYFSNKNQNSCTLDGKMFKKINRIYGSEMPMLSSLAIISAFILAFYLLLKVYDLIFNGGFNTLILWTWESYLFIFELVITSVIPIVFVAIKKMRESPYGLLTASLSASLGLALNRLDVGIFGYFSEAKTIYFPSFSEWTLSIGIIAAAILAFIYVSENYTIFDDNWKLKKVQRGIFSSKFDSFSRVWTTVLQDGIYRISMIAVFTLPIAFMIQYPSNNNDAKLIIQPATGADISRATLLINGNSNNDKTLFPHSEHQNRLGGEQSCVKCHHITMPNDQSTPCSRCHRNMLYETKIFEHSYHTEKVAAENKFGGIHPQNWTCNTCHPRLQAKTKDNAVSCVQCHSVDMNLQNHKNPLRQFIYVNSYMDAMHKNCIPCHSREETTHNKKLSDCSTCHKNSNNIQPIQNVVTKK